VRVIVTGVPGSGKTTLARPLARELGCRYISKDAIKEALWDALGPGDLAWSMQLGAAASVALRTLADGGTGLVIDHPVPAEYADEWRAFPDLVEVHCVCPADVARDRYTQRQRHPCHFDRDRIGSLDEWLADDARREPFAQRLDVDTTRPVDVATIASWVRTRTKD
jgi:predicted kinase